MVRSLRIVTFAASVVLAVLLTHCRQPIQTTPGQEGSTTVGESGGTIVIDDPESEL
jgi:hypothetical protein